MTGGSGGSVGAGWSRALAGAVVARKGPVLAAWAVAVGAALAYGAPLQTLLRGDISRVPGSVSEQVSQRLTTDFDFPFAHALVVTSVGPLPQALKPRLAEASGVRAVRELQGTGPHGALLVGFGAATPEDEERSVGLVRAIAASTPGAEGAQLATTGLAAFNHDFVTLGSEQASASEARVLPLVLLALLVAFGALGAAVAPLATGLAAVALALAGLTAVAQQTHVSVYALNVASMLGLGLGVDYALFVVARVREARKAGLAGDAAVVEAAAQTAPALLAAAIAVLVGVAALATVPMPELRGMALGGALVAAAALLATLTLLPALVAQLGERLDWPAGLAGRLQRPGSAARWEGLARLVVARPLRHLALAVVLLAALASPLAGFKFGFPELSTAPKTLEAAVGLERIRAMGLGGRVMPIQVIAELPLGESWLTPKRLRELAIMIQDLRGERVVADVLTLLPERPGATIAAAALLGPERLYGRLPAEGRWLLSRDRRQLLVLVLPRGDLPWADVRAFVRELRDVRGPAWFTGGSLLVGGPAAVEIDAIDLCAGALPGLAGLIALATFLALGWLTRSVLVPLKAILANLVTVAAALGVTVGLAGSSWGARLLGLSEPIASVPAFFPIMVFCLLFGLSIDYEVILVSRIQEAHRAGLDDREAVVAGVAASGGLVTSAAAIMVLVFLGFAFTELVPVKLLGVALAVGVALDATVVRLWLVPTMMVVIGRWNWWPGGRATS